MSRADDLVPRERRRLRRWRAAVVFALYAGYAGVLLCRNDVAVALPAMKDDPAVALSNSAAGLLLMFGNLAYLIGKFVMGGVADRIGGRALFTTAVAITAAMTLLFPFVGHFAGYAVVWAICRLAQASAWPSMNKFIYRWFEPHAYSRAWGIISTSSRVGAIVADLGLGAMLLAVHWEYLFVMAGCVEVVFFVVCLVLLRDAPLQRGIPVRFEREFADTDASAKRLAAQPMMHPEEERAPLRAATPDGGDDDTALVLNDGADADVIPPPPVAPAPAQRKPPLRASLRRFFTEPRFYLICLATMSTTLMFEWEAFLPLFLAEQYGMSSGAAGTAAVVYPIGCAISLVVGGVILDRVSRRKGAAIAVGSLALCALSAMGFWVMTTHSAPLGVALALAFLSGLFLGIPAYLPMSVFSLQFGGQYECGLLVGIVDGVGYLMAMVFDLLGGHLSETVGWYAVFIVLLAGGVFGVLTMGLFYWLDNRAADKVAMHSTEQIEKIADEAERARDIGFVRGDRDSDASPDASRTEARSPRSASPRAPFA